MKIFIDGHYYSQEDAKISVFDHGLLYGDGVFEGIRFYNGRVFALDRHLDRLYKSARVLMLTIPMEPDTLKAKVIETIRANGLRDGYVRLIVTRGVGNLGLSPDHCKTPSIIIIASTISLYPASMYEAGLSVITASTRRNSSAALPPAVKSLNYLNNILAKIEAAQAGAVEALMLNDAGYIAECTGDNLFVVRNGRLATPPVSAGSLWGITREVVIRLAQESGYPVDEPELTRYDVFTADECFLTGTAAEVIPVVKLDSRPIGDGRPGPVTKALMARFHAFTQTVGDPIDA